MNDLYSHKYYNTVPGRSISDAMRTHIYVIADALAGGIEKQFPKKF